MVVRIDGATLVEEAKLDAQGNHGVTLKDKFYHSTLSITANTVNDKTETSKLQLLKWTAEIVRQKIRLQLANCSMLQY